MRLVREVEQLAHGYTRKGGTDNRKQQRGRMVDFAEFCAAQGAHSLDQVGRNHVICYWKSNRYLSQRTREGYWYAIRILWRLAGKQGDPPKPFPVSESGKMAL